MDDHDYSTHVVWHGSTGVGYDRYSRRHEAVAPPAVSAVRLSADRAFRGDPDLLNPEQLLVLAASSCQLLSFLALAAREGIDVVDYEDEATGTMPAGAVPMRLTTIALSPVIRVVAGTDHDAVRALVAAAHAGCYIANSLTTTVLVTATVVGA